MKPYSESCDQNRDPILKILQELFANKKHILEIGSGTGQHAVYFAKHMPHLIWQCSDQTTYHDGINEWLKEAKLDNTVSPIALNVSTDDWPSTSSTSTHSNNTDAIFSANTVHIMSWDNVKDFINNAGKLLTKNGLLVLYGPFNYNNQYTSQSNKQFDSWLKQRDSKSGIRDFEDINKLAKQANFILQNDYPMPTNNRILCWKKY